MLLEGSRLKNERTYDAEAGPDPDLQAPAPVQREQPCEGAEGGEARHAVDAGRVVLEALQHAVPDHPDAQRGAHAQAVPQLQQLVADGVLDWLVEGSDPGSRRKNLIFLLDQKIIGFMSIYFQKKWTSCVKFAFRISR